MGNQKKRKYSALVILLLCTLLSLPLHVAAVDENTGTAVVTKLTLDKSIDMASQYTHKFVELDQTIKSMWDQHTDLLNMSNNIQQQLDALNTFTSLYEKMQKGTALTLLEQMEFQAYVSVFGSVPPRYSSEDMFNNFIKNRDFPHYAIWGSIQDLKESKDAGQSALAGGIRQLYDQILGLQDAVGLQQGLYDLMDKQNTQLVLKYNQGQASELDKYVSEVGLQQQKLAVSKLQRTLTNVEMVFKQQIGVPLNQEIVLELHSLDDGTKELPPYDGFLKSALDKRSEIVNAKMDLQVKQRELDIMKQYILNDKLVDRMDEQASVDDKTIALTEAINNVTSDVYTGYEDTKTKQQDVAIALRKKSNADRQCKDVIVEYNNGTIPLSALWSVEFQQAQAEMGYNSALRDYNSALYKLGQASGIGPAYNTGTGGN